MARHPTILGRLFTIALAALAAALTASCTPREDDNRFIGATTDNPLALKLTWFRYLAGEDIRQTCTADTPNHYRFVYNGDYNQQLRTYDVVADHTGSAVVTSRALTGSGIATSIDLGFDDVLASWRWARGQSRMSRGEVAAFNSTLARDAVFRRPDQAITLHSNGFYWVATGCRDGAFFANAWPFADERFQALAFPEALLVYDRTEVAVNPPRARDLAESVRAKSGPRGANRSRQPYFVVELGRDGFVGL